MFILNFFAASRAKSNGTKRKLAKNNKKRTEKDATPFFIWQKQPRIGKKDWTATCLEQQCLLRVHMSKSKSFVSIIDWISRSECVLSFALTKEESKEHVRLVLFVFEVLWCSWNAKRKKRFHRMPQPLSPLCDSFDQLSWTEKDAVWFSLEEKAINKLNEIDFLCFQISIRLSFSFCVFVKRNCKFECFWGIWKRKQKQPAKLFDYKAGWVHSFKNLYVGFEAASEVKSWPFKLTKTVNDCSSQFFSSTGSWLKQIWKKFQWAETKDRAYGFCADDLWCQTRNVTGRRGAFPLCHVGQLVSKKALCFLLVSWKGKSCVCLHTNKFWTCCWTMIWHKTNNFGVRIITIDCFFKRCGR